MTQHPGSERSARRALPPSPLAAFDEAARWTNLAWDAALGGFLRPHDILNRSAQRLRSMVDFARAHTRLYRERCRHLPTDGSWSPSDLPPLSKRELMANFEASLTDPRLTRARIDAFLADPGRVGHLLDDRYAVWTSSGSTGQPAVFVHDREAIALYQALEMFRFRGIASPAALASRLLTGERYAMVAATGGHFAGVATIEHLRQSVPWLARSIRALSLMQPLEALVAQLNAFQPTLLATYPTAVEMLADEQDAGRLRLRLAEIWTGGETLAEPVRRRVQRSFGCRVRNAYGASEFLSIAWDCGHGCLHVNADWVLLEAVDALYRPVAPGTPSHTVLLSNLVNRAQPLLRYDLGDSITVLPQPCTCGSALPAIHVEGRCDDILRFPLRDRPDVKVLPLALATVLEDDAHVHDFQVVQSGLRRLQVRLGQGERRASERVRDALAGFLRAQGAQRVAVEVTAGTPLRCPHSGKLRRVLYAPGLAPAARRRKGALH